MIYYGDEVGLEGGSDPDCRRGMLWDEGRQNLSLLQYYQTLISIRHTYPVLTEGMLIEQYTEDDKGIFYSKRRLGDQQIILIFHTKTGEAKLPGLEGRQNLVDGKPFTGTLGAYETVVLI